jgi:hypothetical protein
MGTIISDCGRYRYRLERQTHGCGATAVIMVNPSTADASIDDATIRKLRGFGTKHGWGHLVVGNLFAFRATDVRDLARIADPVGPDNDLHLRSIIADCDRVIVAWGPLSKQPKYHRGRWRAVMAMIGERPVFSIGEPAKCGHPKHPLMLAYANEIQPWSAP